MMPLEVEAAGRDAQRMKKIMRLPAASFLCAIDGAQLLTNCILKVEQKLFNLVCVGFHHLSLSRVCFLVVKPVEITDHAFGNRCGDFLAKRRRA